MVGCRVRVQLWHALVAQGYRGGRTIVYRFLAQLRQEAGLPLRRQRDAHGPFPDKAARLPTGRQLKWLLLRPPSTWTTAEQGLVEQVCHSSRAVTLAYGVLLDFGTIVRERQRGDLSNWVSVATASAVPELQGFAQGVIRDYAAVRAALELPWSTGPVAGQIHRVKLLERQMYGRAKLDLLRVRVLQA